MPYPHSTQRNSSNIGPTKKKRRPSTDCAMRTPTSLTPAPLPRSAAQFLVNAKPSRWLFITLSLIGWSERRSWSLTSFLQMTMEIEKQVAYCMCLCVTLIITHTQKRLILIFLSLSLTSYWHKLLIDYCINKNYDIFVNFFYLILFA